MKTLIYITLIITFTGCAALKQRVEDARCRHAVNRMQKMQSKTLKWEQNAVELGCLNVSYEQISVDSSSDTLVLHDTIPEYHVDQGYYLYCDHLGNLVVKYGNTNDSLKKELERRGIIYRTRIDTFPDSTYYFTVTVGMLAQIDSLQVIVNNNKKTVQQKEKVITRLVSKLSAAEKVALVLKWACGIMALLLLIAIFILLKRLFTK